MCWNLHPVVYHSDDPEALAYTTRPHYIHHVAGTTSVTHAAGDDTEMAPPGWPAQVLLPFQQSPDLRLLILNDAADPGFPSFPVVRVDKHVEVFERLLPECFVNQGTSNLRVFNLACGWY